MELTHLRAFIAVADAGGFSRAARLIASTQPTLSRQVLGLEKELGRSLFERLGKKVVLTDFGRTVLAKSRSLVTQADALQASGEATGGQLFGLIRLGVADSVILSRLPRLLQKFRNRFPGIRIHVRTGSSLQILTWVREGNCDAGLCMLPSTMPSVKLIPLWSDDFIPLAPSKHPLARQKAVKIQDFAAERQIAIHPETLSHQITSGVFQNAGCTLAADMVFDTFHLVVEFIGAGLGVGIATSISAESALKRKRVVEIKLKEFNRLSRHLGVALHVDRTPEGPLEAFLDQLEIPR